jgi:NAD(P)H-dependent flavin oxidoreductase YrpB (nitropropane dioxygenase family)
MVLVPLVADVAGKVPVLAAVGIADGRGLAAALVLGASGAWIGTRFLASPEATYHPNYKERLIEAAATDTVESTLFDGGWPNAPGRTLRNRVVQLWEDAGRPEVGSRPGEGDEIGRTPEGNIIRRYAIAWEAARLKWRDAYGAGGERAEKVRVDVPYEHDATDTLPDWNKSSSCWFRGENGRIPWIKRAAQNAENEWSRSSPSPAAPTCNA